MSVFTLPAAAPGSGPSSFDSPGLQVECSWLGNSFPGAEAWVQQDIRALTVTPNGTVFTNVEWEEGGGNVGEYRDGRLVRYTRHTHGWGAIDGEYLIFLEDDYKAKVLMYRWKPADDGR